MIGKGAAAEVLSPAAGPTHLPTPPPQGVIGRQGSIDALVTALDVAAPAGAHVPPLSIYGIGGIGKTTVAAQVARTLCESGAFPDGLLWAALGPVARPRPLLEAWGRVLGVDLLGEHTVSACSDRLRAALSGTRTLLVIDDVWAAEDAQPFLVAGTRCRTLLTTREPPVATRLSTRAHAHRLDVLLPQDSLDLLGRLAPGVVERHPAQARELCARVEHLPLALTLAGRLLDAESDVPGRMARLLAELTDQRAARLSMPQDEGRLGLCSRTVSLEAILALSVDRLDAIDRERFAALAVLGGDPLTWDLPTAAAVWACALPAAEETVAHLIQRGIVEPRGDDYWMHAVLADYAAELLDGTSR
ncbi:NB-ARC domain-containing protein [Streptomyces sp. SAI-208]|uniref:NB-ARC domain-containing protein n=1 Tax=Streptomyces sp. SAI-208 TaxID=2940550 RepID=UPI0024741FE8|nr:NB-ARC domain-containing protein [Streptomyces sp. SAI-208]